MQAFQYTDHKGEGVYIFHLFAQYEPICFSDPKITSKKAKALLIENCAIQLRYSMNFYILNGAPNLHLIVLQCVLLDGSLGRWL